MSLLNRLFGQRSRAGSRPASKRVYIIDANGFIEKRYREANGQPSPRDNFFVLKNIALFAQREQVEMAAVFVGRPLREAGEGALFRGVAVHYAADEKALSQKICKIARGRMPRKEVIVITDDRQVEREAMKAGAQCMRLTTLRRGMEGDSDHDRRSRPFQRRNQGSTPAPVEEEQPTASDNEPASDDKPDKNVLDLIDPI